MTEFLGLGGSSAGGPEIPVLADGGAIIFTTSWFDVVGIAGASAVSASKAALRNLTRTLAAELIGRNIRVHCRTAMCVAALMALPAFLLWPLRPQEKCNGYLAI